MKTVIIEVSGGVIQEVYSDSADIRVVKVDWDAGESPGDAFTAGDLLVQKFAHLPVGTRKALAKLVP